MSLGTKRIWIHFCKRGGNMINELYEQILRRENVRENLSRLRAAVKEEKEYKAAKALLGNGKEAEKFLLSNDPKVRKNAAALLGDLEIEEAACALYEAYRKEETLFVRAPLLLALEKTDPYPYLEELSKRYELLCSQEVKEEEKKHIQNELHALERILRKDGDACGHTFTGWDQRFTVMLTTNPAYARVTADKFQARRKGATALGVQAVVDGLWEVADIRTYRELLFPIALGREIFLEDGPEIFGEALAESRVLPLLKRCHEGPAPFYFRLAVKSGLSMEERSRYVRRAAAVIEEKSGRALRNSPEEYEFEIRLMTGKSGAIRIFLKMFTIPMERFSYRKKTIAASMHPSLAAMLLELARPYMKVQAKVLDPCCGSGTMLVERNKILSVREAYGIDVFQEAVLSAKVNTKEAGMEVNFIQKDYLRFAHRDLFDEIIANMPLRGKQSKEEQDLFYEGFFNKSEELLAPGGIMILYSNENGFVKKQLRLHPKFWLCKEYLIREKEQFWLFMIGRKRK